MSVANNIKKLREAHGLTQSELGKIAGVSDKAVSSWEHGLSVPRMGAIEHIAAYFHVPKGDIVNDDPEFLSPEEIVIIEYCRQLNSDGLARLTAYAEDLTASRRYEEK